MPQSGEPNLSRGRIDMAKVEIGRRVARGGSSVVHWLPEEPDHVIKIKTSPHADYMEELRRMLSIRLMGIPVPRAHRVERVDGWEPHTLYGIVYDNVEGKHWDDYVWVNAERAEQIAVEMAALHALIHSRDGMNLPKDPKAEGPLCLCHGYFYPGNVIRTDAGPMILSWGRACRGSAADDVARALFCLMMIKSEPIRKSLYYIDREGKLRNKGANFASRVWDMAKDPPEDLWFYLIHLRRKMAAIYLREYERITGIERQPVMSKLVSLAEAHGIGEPWDRYIIRTICDEEFDLDHFVEAEY